MTLTAGSELKVPATSSNVSGGSLNHAVGLTDSLAIAFFVDEDGDAQVDLKAQLIDISALTATLDAASKITVRTHTNGTTAMVGYGCRLTDTSALYVYRYRLSGETDFTEVAQVFTVSGSTITANTPVTIRTLTSPNSGDSWKLVPLTSTKVMRCYWRFNGSSEWELFASVITISGTTPTINAAATVYISPASPLRDASTDRYHLTNASSTTAVVQHAELDSGGTGWYEIFAYVLSAPTTTVTVGAAASMSSNDANNGSFETQQWVARLGNNKIGSYTTDATLGTEAYQVLTLSGTSISVGTVSTPPQVFEPNSPATGFESDLILAYDRGTSTANDEAVEFSLIGATIPVPSDTLAWTPTNRPDRQTPLAGAALPTVITSANSTSAPTGHLYVRLYRSSLTPTPPVTSDTWAAAPLRKPCSIDADGGFIYIAALNSSGNPILIQFSTALNADGTVVFNPGAGDDIGVECSPTDADTVWVAGAFDGTNTVERSNDGATTFDVVDPGTFSPVTAFKVGPDSDDRCLVALLVDSTVDTVEIHETIDDGAAWVEIASGLTSPVQILAMDRLDTNPTEVVFGNADNTTDRSDYSPNSGANLDDITTGTPTDDTTTVIVG